MLLKDADAAWQEEELRQRTREQREEFDLWNAQRAAIGLEPVEAPVEQVMGSREDAVGDIRDTILGQIHTVIRQEHIKTRGGVDAAATRVENTIADGLAKTRDEMNKATRNIRDDIAKAKTELARECRKFSEVREILQCLLIVLGQLIRVCWTANKTIYYTFRIVTFFLHSGVEWVPAVGMPLKSLITLVMSILFIMIYANIVTYTSLGYVDGDFVIGKALGWGIHGVLWCWGKMQGILGGLSTQGHTIGAHAGLNITQINQQVQQWGGQLQVYKTVAEGAQAVGATAVRAGQAVATGASAVVQGAQTTAGTIANVTRAAAKWVGFGGRTRKKRRGKKHTKTRRKNKKYKKKNSKKRNNSRRRKKTRRRRRRTKYQGGALDVKGPATAITLSCCPPPALLEPYIKPKKSSKTQIASKENRQQLLPLLNFIKFQEELIDKLFLKEMILTGKNGQNEKVSGGIIGAITWMMEEAMEKNKKKIDVKKIDDATLEMVTKSMKESKLMKEIWGSTAPKAQVMSRD